MAQEITLVIRNRRNCHQLSVPKKLESIGKGVEGSIYYQAEKGFDYAGKRN